MIFKDNYLTPAGSGDTFSINFDKLPLRGNYFEESLLAAQELESKKEGNLYLMYSGGVDSEYALSCFIHQGIKITPVIVKLNPGYNDYDTKYAFKFCSAKGLDPLVIDIDYDDFIQSGKMLEISLETKSSVPHYSTTAFAIGQLDGTVICGDGEPYIKLDTETNTWNIVIYEYEFALPNFYKQHNIPGTPRFNNYTRYMERAFLEDRRMKELASKLVPGKLGSHSSKYLIYNRHSNFRLESRQKYHGLEKIEKSDIYNHITFKKLKIIGSSFDGVYSTDFFEFMNRL
ncbi:MAG: hypothetical protein EBV10_02680 [Synechococcaceae bacterium WB6_1A_059]|nr:hypothetical protein [Synechococcaceae bacterium WB6_1A_059]